MRATARLILTGALACVALFAGSGTSAAAIGTITIDGKAELSADRTQATITGTVNCDEGDVVNMFANITETVGRVQQRLARNLTLNTITCIGTPQPWSVTVTALSRPLLPGPVRVGSFAFDQIDGTQAQALGTLLLTPSRRAAG